MTRHSARPDTILPQHSTTSRAIALIAILSVTLLSCDSDPLEPEPELVPIAELLGGFITTTPNPSGRAPLTAEISFRTKEPVRVSWLIDGSQPLEHFEDALRSEFILPVVGLYPNTTNEIVLRLETGSGTYALDTLLVATPPVPEFFPDIEVTVNSSQIEPGWFQSDVSLGLGGRYGTIPIVYDNEGTVRWYIDFRDFGGMSFMLEPLRNGNFVTAYGHEVYEIDLLGREVNTWNLGANIYHHDLVEKPNGNFIVAVDVEGWATIEDAAIEIDRGSGQIVDSWDLRPLLDMDRRTLAGSDNDWFHMNSVWYDETDGGVIFSGRNQGVVKIGPDHELKWILAPHAGWESNQMGQDLNPFLLTAVDASGTPYPEAVQMGHERTADFDWSWGQHAAMRTDAGHIFLFDNGFLRQFSQDAFYSRAVEYDVDPDAMTVRQVWGYGRQKDRDGYAAIVSDVDILPETGNRLFMPGIVFDPPNKAWVTEVTYPGGEPVAEVKLTLKNQFGSGAFAWGEFDLVYRSGKMNFSKYLGSH